MKTNWLDRRIAHPGPHLALCLSEDEFKSACEDIGIAAPAWIKNTWSNATAHVFESNGDISIVICMRDFEGRDPVEVAGLLIHESVHIWQQHIERIGEDRPGAEQEAYAIQAIAQELLAEFARRQSHHA